MKTVRPQAYRATMELPPTEMPGAALLLKEPESPRTTSESLSTWSPLPALPLLVHALREISRLCWTRMPAEVGEVMLRP